MPWEETHGSMPIESAYWFSVTHELSPDTLIEVLDAKGQIRRYAVGPTPRQLKPKGTAL